MKNQIVKTENGNFDLNGLPVSARGTTMYKDVFFGNSGWQVEGDCYVAIAGLTEEEQKISGKQSFMFHLSKHDDARAAAYVAMKFNEDREKNVEALRNTKTGAWECEVPSFQFEQLDSPEMQNRRAGTVVRSKKIKKAAAGVAIDNRMADAEFAVILKKVNIQEMISKFGKEVLMQARKVLTINEFELRFGIK